MSALRDQHRLSRRSATQRRKAPANNNAEPLTICLGVSTSALFNIRAIDLYYKQISQKYGPEKAKQLYRDHIAALRAKGEILSAGPASALIRKVLSFDGLAGINIDLAIISRNHPDMGGMVNDSLIQYPWLIDGDGFSRIKSGSFTSGEPISPERVKGHSVDLLLCTNPEDAKRINASGLSAARLDHILEGPHSQQDEERLVIGFDFDRVLGFAPHPSDATKDAEAYYRECVDAHGANEGLRLYKKHMQAVGEDAAAFTHLTQFFRKLYEARQRVDALRADKKTQKKIVLRIVTARGFDAFPQIAATLEMLGTPEMEVDFLNGKSKSPFIHDCDIFFDDIPKNLAGARLGAEVPAAVHPRVKTLCPVAMLAAGDGV